MTASWTKRAELELQEIIDRIADDNPIAAYEWGERLVRRADAAARMKLSGRVVPELGREDVREVFLGAYRIMYRVTGAGIVVITVLEGHMQVRPDLDPDAR
ncbi:MAG: type II toxin-antitoxin system RelE/ParE family toxin [Myxococcales bacterium]|nr:type II toxin-antitoxin system RelE/ParE family toxin [Myxococcales bacterium]